MVSIKLNNCTGVPVLGRPAVNFDPPGSCSGKTQHEGQAQETEWRGGTRRDPCSSVFSRWAHLGLSLCVWGTGLSPPLDSSGVTEVQKSEMLTPEGLWTTWLQLQLRH